MMKNNKAENEIFTQIKQSLERYEEAYIPGAWEGFLQQRKRRQRKILWLISSGIAACLLIGFIGLNLILPEKNAALRSPNGQITNLNRETPNLENHAARVAAPAMDSTRNAAHFKTPGKELLALSEKTKKPMPETKAKIAAPSAVAGQTIDSSKLVSTLSTGTNILLNKANADTVKNSSDTLRGKTNTVIQEVLPAKEGQNLAALPKRKIRFGINFSPAVTSSQSEGSFNYLGGVSADISLFSNVQLSTGLQLENQSIVKKFPGIVSSPTAPVNQTRTKMINLDVPLNITWKFFSEKSNSYYVAAGLSTLVYLSQENKNTTYSQMLVPVTNTVAGEAIKSYSLVDQVSVTQNTVSPAQTFDFAGRLNLIIGFEKKLSNRIYIHFEPYAKIPTSGQAAENLKQTSTGVNFKISF